MGKLIAPLLGSLGVSAATAATIGTIASSIGTAMSLGSMFKQGQAQQQQFAGEIASTRYNAATTSMEASERERKLTREQTLRAGSQKAAGGAQGRGDGNVLDIMADTAYQSELDILGVRTANQMQQELASSRISAIKSSAKTAKASTLLTGVSTLAGSLGKGISSYGGSDTWANGDPFRTR